MSNIATQRVQREFREFRIDETAAHQYSIEMLEDGDLQNLQGSITGPPDTPYAGGTFMLDIKIPDTYPFAPPKVRFITRVWHPNISSATGAICLDILKDQWAAAMTIRTVLLSLQTLLAVPEASDPQDAVVARQYIDNHELFRYTSGYWTYLYALPCTQELTPVMRTRTTPVLSRFPTAKQDMPITKYAEFNTKVKKLVEIMNTDEITAMIALSSHLWDLDRATQALIS